MKKAKNFKQGECCKVGKNIFMRDDECYSAFFQQLTGKDKGGWMECTPDELLKLVKVIITVV